VPEIVRQASGIDDVRIAAERGPEFPANLRHFQAVGQPISHEII
jgi:hypothetical protein